MAKLLTVLVLIGLAWGSWDLLKIELEYPIDIAPSLPRWLAIMIMPFAFALMSIKILFKSYSKYYYKLSFFLVVIVFSFTELPDLIFDYLPELYISYFVILVSLFYGAPIFVGLGGLAIILFWADYTPVSAISAEAYRIVVSPTLPTIPLFTMAGYFLAESKASKDWF